MANESRALSDLIDANRKMHRARVAFYDQGDNKGRAKALGAEVDKAMAESAESVDAGVRLLLFCELLQDVTGPEAVKQLLKILGHDEPGVRVGAGEALVNVLTERWAEASKVVEGALSTLSLEALRELPFVLIEAGEPTGGALIAKLLPHADADVAASAIEALVEIGDTTHLDAIKKLVDDKRPLSGDEDEDGEESSGGGTLGELAAEAVSILSA